MINILNASQTLLVANAVTMGMFRTNLANFLLPKALSPSTATDNTWEVTAGELIGGFTGGIVGTRDFGIYRGEGSNWKGIGSVIQHNLKMRGGQMAFQLITIPIAFKLGKKLLAKPLINPINRGLKQVGLASTVKV